MKITDLHRRIGREEFMLHPITVQIILHIVPVTQEVIQAAAPAAQAAAEAAVAAEAA